MGGKSEERSIANVLRVLPDLLRMEDLGGLPLILMRNWGVKNFIPILSGTVRKVGLINATTSLLTFRLDRIVRSLVLSLWDVLEDEEGVVSGDKRFTFGELEKRVAKLANVLCDWGLKPKEHVSSVLFPCSEGLELFWGCSFIGGVVEYLNFHLNDEDMTIAINKANPRVLVFDEEFTERVMRIKDNLITVEKFVVVGERAPDGMLLYEDMLSKASDEMPESDVFIFGMGEYTGGTTGIPKNINLYDQMSYAFSSVAEPLREKESFTEYLKLFLMLARSLVYEFDGITSRGQNLSPLPLHHGMGSFTAAAFSLFGATTIFMRKFDAKEFMRIIEKEKINHASVVPTILQRILALPDEVKHKYDLSSMKNILCAGAKCPPEVKKGINELFRRQGCESDVYIEGDGCIEVSYGAFLRQKDYQENPKRYESSGKAGRVAYIKVYDEEEKKWCPPNESGRVMYRSIGVTTLRYRGEGEEKVKEGLNIIDGKAWFDCGDYGYLDEDDFLYITGKSRDVIIVGGANIYPYNMEDTILRNPKVFDAVVIAAPDKDLGEVPLALIQLKKGKKSSAEEVIEYCKREGLSGYEIPRKVEFVEEVPREAMGKIIRRKLEEKYWEERGMKR